MLDEKGSLPVCPVCGEGPIGYRCWRKRYGCLNPKCNWEMVEECEIGDQSGLEPTSTAPVLTR